MIKKFLFFICTLSLIVLPGTVFASDEMTDDLNDLSLIYQKSENIVLTNDDLNGLYTSGDLSYIQRSSLSPEWISYQLDRPFSVTVKTYFWPGEPVDHFSFYVSDNHTDWRKIPARITTTPAKGESWTAVNYQISQTKHTDRYFKIEYQNLKGTSWTPMLNQISFGTFLGEMESNFSDMDGHPNQKASEVVSALGILNGYSDGTFRPDNQLSRAELARIFSNIIKTSTQYYGIYSDVPKTHWAACDIEALYRFGIMSGVGNNCFAPEETVTKMQAIKSIVSLLGYTEIAEMSEGYPEGYLKQAFSLGFLKNIALIPEQAVTRGEFVQMLYQSLELPMTEKSIAANPVLSITKETTILSHYLKAQRKTGIVYANEFTRLTGNNPAPIKQVEINEQYYNIGSTKITDAIGCFVEYYTTLGNETETILYYSKKGLEQTISDKEFISWTHNEIISKNKAEKETTYKITPETRIIYNEIYDCKVGEANLNNYSLQNGYLTLIDNNKDHIYELIKIFSYDTYHIKLSSSSIQSIYDSSSGKIELSLEDVTHLFWYENGFSLSTKEAFFSMDSVAEILLSKDRSYAKIYITQNSFSGIIEEIQSDKLIISGKEYEWNTYFQPSDVATGENYRFYTDKQGRITFAKHEDRSVLQYGVYLGKNVGNFEEISVKLLDKDGIIQKYPLHHQIQIDNSSFTDSQTLKNMLDSIGTQYGNLILYRLNSDGMIKEIIRSTDGVIAGGSGFYRNFSGTAVFRGGVLNTFLGTHRVKSTTKIFVLPDNLSDDKSYRMFALSDFIDGENYQLELYDTDENYDIKAIVLKDKKTYNKKMTALSHLVVVDSISAAINDAGEICNRLYYYDNGVLESKNISERLEYFSSPIAVSALPKQGDIVQFSENKNGEIEAIRRLGTADHSTPYEFNMYIGGDVYALRANVSDKFSDRMLVVTPQNTKQAVSLSEGQIYCIKSGKITPSDADEILPDDVVSVITQETSTKLILIIR